MGLDEFEGWARSNSEPWAGSVFRSLDGGRRWQTVFPFNPSVADFIVCMYTASGLGIGFVLTPGGDLPGFAWNLLCPGLFALDPFRVGVKPNIHYFRTHHITGVGKNLAKRPAGYAVFPKRHPVMPTGKRERSERMEWRHHSISTSVCFREIFFNVFSADPSVTTSVTSNKQYPANTPFHPQYKFDILNRVQIFFNINVGFFVDKCLVSIGRDITGFSQVLGRDGRRV